jgi:phosphoribosylanthranilate isomerase
MIDVKVCGITNLEDALVACECGVDALGFILYPQTPRYITPDRAREIIKALPGRIKKVGVFVNQNAGDVQELEAFCGFDFLQFHGDETPEYCGEFPPEIIIKAVSLRTEEDLRRALEYPSRAVLVDCRDRGLYGGTGETADWALARNLGMERPLILAGGLKAENIREAIESVLPAAVDINSGVEMSPGKKDAAKVKDVIEIIRTLKKNKGVSIFR